MAGIFEHCERLVREGDKDRFLSALFVSPERRPLVYALYAFDLEIAAIGVRAQQPIAGEIRLQWWREVIEGERGNEAAASPVAAAVLAAIGAANLPREPLLDLLDARGFDVDRAPMTTLAEFEHYARRTAGAILRSVAALLEEGDEPPPDAAVASAAFASTALWSLRNFALQTSRGQMFIPADLLDAHGVDGNEVRAGRTTPALRAALATFRAAARERTAEGLRLLEGVAPRVRPAFLPVSLAPLYLDRMERADYDPFTTAVDVPQWRRQWRLWRAARALGR